MKSASAFIDRPSSAAPAPLHPRIDRRMDARVRHLRVLRDETERAKHLMQEETRNLTAALTARGMTLRDVGELLGISYQRVQQILKGA